MACVAHPAVAQIFTYRACELKLATGRKVWAAITKGRREKRKRRFDAELYKERNRVERLVGRLKQFRRVATRYEKTAESYLTMLTLAAILLWL